MMMSSTSVVSQTSPERCPARAVAVCAVAITRIARLPVRAWCTAHAVLAESRPCVQFVVALRLICMTDVLVQPSMRRATTLLGWLSLSLAVYLLNGLSDVEADRSNGSARPIASGRLSSATATGWCAGLAIGGLAAVAYAGAVVTLAALAYLALGWAYSAGPRLKNYRYGSVLAVGGGAGLTYAAGLVVAHEAAWRELALVLLLSAWIGVGSMSKDFSDIDGDAVAGRRTAPVLFGSRRAATTLAAQTLPTSVAVTLLGVTLHSIAAWAPGLLLVAGSVVLTVTARRFGSAQRRSVRRMPYRVFMSTQYLVDFALLAVLAR